MTAANPAPEQHTRIYFDKAITALDALWNHTRFLRDEAYTAHRASGYTHGTGQVSAVAEELVTLTAAALQNLDTARRVLAKGLPQSGDAMPTDLTTTAEEPTP